MKNAVESSSVNTPSASKDDSKHFRRHLRFSLKTLLVSILLIGSLMAIFFLQGELAKARNQVSSLQKKYGVIDVKTPSVLYGMRLRTLAPLTWRWRFHVPANAAYRLQVAYQNVRKNELPKTGNDFAGAFSFGLGVTQSAREVEFTVNIDRSSKGYPVLRCDYIDPNRSVHDKTDVKRYETTIPEKGAQWAFGSSGHGIDVGAFHETQKLDASGPKVLLRINQMNQKGQPGPYGLLVWIENED